MPPSKVFPQWHDLMAWRVLHFVHSCITVTVCNVQWAGWEGEEDWRLKEGRRGREEGMKEWRKE